MARLTVPETGQTMTKPEEMKHFLAAFSMQYEFFPVSKSRRTLPAEHILAEFDSEISFLKQQGGYQTADLIDLTPATSGLDQMLAKFSTEHTHSEDEVRFCIDGRGIFHINPVKAPVFSIEMESGDLINVPAGTRHWFNLCQEKTVRVIRLFQDITGWTPHYTPDGTEKNFQPLCFSQLHASIEKSKESVVKS